MILAYFSSTLQLFKAACLAYLSSGVRPKAELGVYLNREGFLTLLV